jgi:hypothetical protein
MRHAGRACWIFELLLVRLADRGQQLIIANNAVDKMRNKSHYDKLRVYLLGINLFTDGSRHFCARIVPSNPMLVAQARELPSHSCATKNVDRLQAALAVIRTKIRSRPE